MIFTCLPCLSHVLLISKPSLALYNCYTRSSVSTGWIIPHFVVYSDFKLRNLRLEHSCWFSTLIPISEILLNKGFILASCSFIHQPCSNTFCSSLLILSDYSLNSLECTSITCCSLMVFLLTLNCLNRGFNVIVNTWLDSWLNQRYNSFRNCLC